MKKFLICLVLTFLFLESGAFAQISIKVSPGFSSALCSERVNPVTVELHNQGSSVDGEVAVQQSLPQSLQLLKHQNSVTFKTPISLPQGSVKRCTVYVDYPYSNKEKLQVSFRSGVRTLSSQTISVSPIPKDDRNLLLVNKTQGGLDFLTGLKIHTDCLARVFHTLPADLPENWQGYDCVDVLALGDFDLQSLTLQQKKAIKSWVHSGGVLVFLGGSNGQRLTDPFFKDLLPVQITGDTQTSFLNPFIAYCGTSNLGPSPVLIPTSTIVTGGNLSFEQNGIPLFASRHCGLGMTYYIAPDLSTAPYDGWTPQRKIWVELLNSTGGLESVIPTKDSNDILTGDETPEYIPKLNNVVTDITAMKVPGYGIIIGFLAVYLIALVPVNYFELKKKNKLEYSWFTIPVIVMIFFFLAYGVGFTMKGGSLLLNQATLMETTCGCSEAVLYNATSLFSPARATYNLRIDDPSAAISNKSLSNSKKNLVIQTGENPSVENFSMPMWSMQVFDIKSTVDLGGTLEADTREANGILQGEIHNNTKYDLMNCVIDYSGKYYELGDITANSQNISIPKPSIISNICNHKGYSAKENSILGKLTGSVNHDRSYPILYASIRKSVSPVRLDGENPKIQSAAILCVRLPLGGSVNPIVTDYTGVQWSVPNPNIFWSEDYPYSGDISGIMGHGSIILQATFPIQARGTTCGYLRINNAKITDKTAKLEYQILDVNSNQWHDLDNLNQAISNPQLYVNKNSEVIKIKITNKYPMKKNIGPLWIDYAGK